MDPGPIEVLDPSRWDLTMPAEAPPAELAALEEELTALDAELDQDLAGMSELLETDPRPELEQLHAEAEEGVYQDRDCGDEGEVGEAEVAAEETGWMLNDAFVAIPSQAWEEVPDPYTPPPETGGFTPEPGTVGPTPSPIDYQPPSPPPGPPAPSVDILNLTRGGKVDFYIGDAWRITITGPPQSPVTIGGWHDTEPLTRVLEGYTDSAGHFRLEGRMWPGTEGYWVEAWEVAGQACQPAWLGFFVR